MKIMKALYQLAKAFNREIEDFFGEGSFKFGNHTITYTIGESSNSVEVYNPAKDTYLDRVADYLEGFIQPCSEKYDIWDDHGFRDEEDYWKYKI